MTDASSLVPNRVAMASDALFTLKPTAPPCRSMRASIPSSNAQTFVGGTTSIFYVPGGRRNTLLDSSETYLKFTVFNNDIAANTMYCDNCAYSPINRIDIYHGSNLLDTIQQVNVLFNYITDCQLTPSAKNGLSTAYGFSRFGTPSSSRQGMPIAGQTKMTFCVPILSGLFTGLDSYLPLCNLADDIRIEITWEQPNISFYYGTATALTYTITQAELELTIIEMSDQGMAMIESVTSLNQTMYLHGNSWRHYVGNMPALSSGGFSYLVPARFASLKQLVVLPRKNDSTSNQQAYSVGSRINPQISQYFFRIGSYLIPNKPVTLQSSTNMVGGYAEGFMELLRA